jgi:hypothetical protein
VTWHGTRWQRARGPQSVWRSDHLVSHRQRIRNPLVRDLALAVDALGVDTKHHIYAMTGPFRRFRSIKGGAPRRLAALRPLAGRACGLGAGPGRQQLGPPSRRAQLSPLARLRHLP